ncbi:MAG: hypothetical protein N3A57_05025 [Negativicutes bacterium]|nr:hypothetical protein [Negativicutes bacterium]
MPDGADWLTAYLPQKGSQYMAGGHEKYPVQAGGDNEIWLVATDSGEKKIGYNVTPGKLKIIFADDSTVEMLASAVVEGGGKEDGLPLVRVVGADGRPDQQFGPVRGEMIEVAIGDKVIMPAPGAGVVRYQVNGEQKFSLIGWSGGENQSRLVIGGEPGR